MKNEKILKMINENKISELEAMIKDEIYCKSLGRKSASLERYKAMKRFFKYESDDTFLYLCYPGRDIMVNGKLYNTFIDGTGCVITTEDLGELESITKNDYMNIAPLFDTTKFTNKETERVNLSKILAEAKVRGYRYKKSEVVISQDFHYLFEYKHTFYKIGLIDKFFSIINDNNDAYVMYIGEKYPLYISTIIGKMCLLPLSINFEGIDKVYREKIVISTEDSIGTKKIN